MELLRAPAEPLWSRLGNIRRRHRAVTKGSGVVFTRTVQPDSLAPQNAGAESSRSLGAGRHESPRHEDLLLALSPSGRRRFASQPGDWLLFQYAQGLLHGALQLSVVAGDSVLGPVLHVDVARS